MSSRWFSLGLVTLLTSCGILPAQMAEPERPPPTFHWSWGKKGEGRGEFRSSCRHRR
jgi:hypothetical protein